MRKIFYTKKYTSASTVYMDIKEEDLGLIISKMLALQSYMNELSLSTNRDIKEVVRWYNKPSKTLPFNKQFSKSNSPCSFIAGMINNLVYGHQINCSEIQAQHIQNIINNCSSLIMALNEMGIELQKNANYESILFCEELFEYTK